MQETHQLTRERLTYLYKNFTLKEICQELSISYPTLVKYLKKFRIRKKGAGNRTNHRRAIVLIHPKTIESPFKVVKNQNKEAVKVIQ